MYPRPGRGSGGVSRFAAGALRQHSLRLIGELLGFGQQIESSLNIRVALGFYSLAGVEVVGMNVHFALEEPADKVLVPCELSAGKRDFLRRQKLPEVLQRCFVRIPVCRQAFVCGEVMRRVIKKRKAPEKLGLETVCGMAGKLNIWRDAVAAVDGAPAVS